MNLSKILSFGYASETTRDVLLGKYEVPDM